MLNVKPSKRATDHPTGRTVAPASTHRSFDLLPDSSFIRASQLVQSSKRPGCESLLPFSAPTLWRKVKEGSFPAPHKLSAGVTAWNVGAVRAWLRALPQTNLQRDNFVSALPVIAEAAQS